MEALCSLAKQFPYILTLICGIYYSTAINTEYQMGLLFESPFSVLKSVSFNYIKKIQKLLLQLTPPVLQA